MTRRFFLCFVGIVLQSALFGQDRVSGLAITVKGTSREFAYTNKESAFLYGETNGENRSSWQGFNVHGREIVDGYALLINEKRVSPAAALSCTVYPDHLERTYSGGIVEEVRPVDSLNLFAIVLRSPRPIGIGIIPWFTDARERGDLTIDLRSELALIARNSDLSQASDSPIPRWLAIHAPGSTPQQIESRERGHYSPVLVYSSRGKRHLFVVAAAPTMETAALLARNFPAEAEARFEARRTRMEKLLVESETSTEDTRFNRALAWAKLSLDALIMNQGKKGIFAGLPWFNNYWGRDTFISLPGAVLVTGRFGEAREILRSFGDFQERDSSSSNYGRIPNYVNPTDRAYNTADGTPRFVMMAKEYIERSGDRRFLAEMFPVVVRAIEGTLCHHSDSLCFLTHGDAESWMDAAGPEGAWSPRGNRANDVQELWAAQLEAGIWFATQVGDVSAARSWSSTLSRLRKNFQSYFVHNGNVADHVTIEGRPDWSLRPNQVFTAPMLDEQTRARMVFRVTSELTYPYGVASLSQDDPRFHPYHQNPPYYPKDAAYHNGTVWTWLQGPVISELCRYGQEEIAWKVTSNSIHQILDRGAVGTQSELLDALPRPGASEPALSGTFSQAWNLAEFIRNWYDDYLGFSIRLFPRTLILQPNIPKALGAVEANVPVGEATAHVRISRTKGARRIELRTENLGFSLHATVHMKTAENNLLHISFSLPDGIPSTITLQGHVAKVVVGKTEVPAEVTIDNAPSLPTNLGKLKLASPVLRQGLSSQHWGRRLQQLRQ